MVKVSERPALPRWASGRMPFYGWLIVAVGILVVFSSGPGQSYVFSVFIDSIIKDTGLSRTTVSALYAVGTGVSAVMVFVVSRLADRHGVRRTLPLVALFMGCACFGIALSAGFVSFFIAFAALRALGQGSMTINSTLAVAQWFVRKRGRAMAVVGLGSAVSSAVLPPLARALITSIGWRGAYMVLGVGVWVLVIPAALLVLRDRPEDVGLHPDGALEPPRGEAPRGVGLDEPARRNALTTWRFWHLALPMSVPSFVVTALIFHQASIFEEQGLSADLAAAVFVPYALAAASCGVLAGFLIDRVGPRNLFIANLGVLLLGTLAAHVLVSPAAAVGYALVMGVSGGMQSVIGGVTWAHYYGRHGLGHVQGAATMVTIASSAVGPLPLAALRSAAGGYGLGLTLMAILPLGAIALMTTYRPRQALAAA